MLVSIRTIVQISEHEQSQRRYCTPVIPSLYRKNEAIAQNPRRHGSGSLAYAAVNQSPSHKQGGT